MNIMTLMSFDANGEKMWQFRPSKNVTVLGIDWILEAQKILYFQEVFTKRRGFALG